MQELGAKEHLVSNVPLKNTPSHFHVLSSYPETFSHIKANQLCEIQSNFDLKCSWKQPVPVFNLHRAFRKAVVKALMKNVNLDPEVIGNHGLVSNLLSEILERVAADQLQTPLNINSLHVNFKSAMEMLQHWGGPSLHAKWFADDHWWRKESCFRSRLIKQQIAPLIMFILPNADNTKKLIWYVWTANKTVQMA